MRNAHSKIKKITPAIDTEQPQRVPFSQFVALSGWFTVVAPNIRIHHRHISHQVANRLYPPAYASRGFEHGV